MQLTIDCQIAVTLLLGLWMYADDAATFEWRPAALKARILPAIPIKLDGLLEVLMRAGFVLRFEAQGRSFGVVRDLAKFPGRPPRAPCVLYAPSEA